MDVVIYSAVFLYLFCFHPYIVIALTVNTYVSKKKRYGRSAKYFYRTLIIQLYK